MIEKYKGYEIYFDEDEDNYVMYDEEGNEMPRQGSIMECERWIDYEIGEDE